MLLKCAEDESRNQRDRLSASTIKSTNSPVTQSLNNVTHDPEKHDSGIESGRTDVTRQGKPDAPTPLLKTQQLLPKSGLNANIPWEIFLTGRKMTVSVYIRRSHEQRSSLTKAVKKPIFLGANRSFQIKPVVQVQLVHPALIMKTQSQGPHMQISCYDVNITGRDISKGG